MSTVRRRLPAQPHLDVPKRQARELLHQIQLHSKEAVDRVRRCHPKFHAADDESIVTRLKLSDAQLVIAREYNFSSWAQLKLRIAANTAAEQIRDAIRANEIDEVIRLLKDHPGLLDVPVVSGNWGPPMSHAANLGLLDMVKAIKALGATDIQHAFDRALLQGKIETARWLHEHGAVLVPGIIMGACETLNSQGFAFVDDAGGPLTNEKGDRLAPLALVLETYSRNPDGKHAILRRFKARGYDIPDTPLMAFHLGDLDRLKIHLKHDPQLLNRRFDHQEIYPPQLGCGIERLSGMCGTPVTGTTLLHLSIDFDEREIFDWLLAEGADVDATAVVDEEGFGGHTPLFNAIVSCAYVNGRQRDGYMARRLLDQGADVNIRVNLRKYLDWREIPGWHIARNVTPLEWAQGFPEQGWVSREVVAMVDQVIRAAGHGA
ncbi:hypothetical protein DCC81_08155 [Chitinophaga parva]|uniref:Uncharacterized protein n=1 Tax=Chitinophaga parva TaxID=2169414 RepID=A0A2T7BP34_9BACT|nr:ankyrin repeat domain-containing protein [Chitinophaga parva]PUZ29409.1 hypothetical protein DCC81_08155 [Chitinophaga parva]